MRGMNKSDVQLILKQLNIKPKKHLGQNFLIDKNIRDKIISTAEISKNDIILEIGPGLGALTEKLIDYAKQVYAIEIEPHFYSYLKNKFSDIDNLKLINGDILNVEVPPHNKVVSNIPYSITGPILERIFFTSNPPHGILTIESKLAERIFFRGDYKKYSRLTISVNSFMEPIQRYSISRNSFYPTPGIDLSLIKINPKVIINPFLLENKNIQFYLKFIAGIMPYKNKNIVNALEIFFSKTTSLNKQEIIKILQENKFENKKVFTFKSPEFIELCKLFYNLYNKHGECD